MTRRRQKRPKDIKKRSSQNGMEAPRQEVDENVPESAEDSKVDKEVQQQGAEPGSIAGESVESNVLQTAFELEHAAEVKKLNGHEGDVKVPGVPKNPVDTQAIAKDMKKKKQKHRLKDIEKRFSEKGNDLMEPPKEEIPEDSEEVAAEEAQQKDEEVEVQSEDETWEDKEESSFRALDEMWRDFGKLTYERDFLWQFETIPMCMLKPEGLPDLENLLAIGQAQGPSTSGYQQKMAKTDAGENIFLPSYLCQNSRVEEVDEVVQQGAEPESTAEEFVDTAVLPTASELEHAAEDEKVNGHEGDVKVPGVPKNPVDMQATGFVKECTSTMCLQRQLRVVGQPLKEEHEQGENLQRKLREMEKQLREKDKKEKKLQRQLRGMEEQVISLQGQCKEKDQESSNLERQLRDRDQDLVEVHKTLSETERKLEKCKCQEKRDWIIPRDDILITDKRLGRGAWGYVHEGKYCGCTVAVKKLHEKDVISPLNRGKFEREMDIASRCRHPCLLQFIGATNDEESPLFVTELMELSLRQLLNNLPLSAGEVVTISLDVARALSYLHNKKPSPILHRDVSSPNVLLWRRDNQWRAKVSDYGTANFLQDTMTANPGTMIYSAPEACARTQTVKIDVYSFGVLLCEMCIRETPEPDRRDTQVQLVKNTVIRALVKRCVQSAAEDRPSMEEIIEELEKLNGTS